MTSSWLSKTAVAAILNALYWGVSPFENNGIQCAWVNIHRIALYNSCIMAWSFMEQSLLLDARNAIFSGQIIYTTLEIWNSRTKSLWNANVQEVCDISVQILWYFCANVTSYLVYIWALQRGITNLVFPFFSLYPYVYICQEGIPSERTPRNIWGWQLTLQKLSTKKLKSIHFKMCCILRRALNTVNAF